MTVAEIINELNKEILEIATVDEELGNEHFYYRLKHYRDMLNQLDERPKAKWVEKDIQELECSNCGTISEFGLEKYCWGCGCEMIDIVLKDDKENNKC